MRSHFSLNHLSTIQILYLTCKWARMYSVLDSVYAVCAVRAIKIA